MTRRTIALLLLAIAIIAFFSRKDIDPLKGEIDQLTLQREEMMDQIKRADGRMVPVVVSFDETRYKLRSLAVKPKYATSLFTSTMTAASPRDLVAKLSYLKNILPYSYIDKMTLDKGGMITATVITKERGR